MAASTLVAAAASDAWEAVRSRLGRLLGRGDPHLESAVLAQLAEARTVAPAEPRFQALIRARLAAEPASVADLELFLQDVRRLLTDQGSARPVVQTAHSDRGGQIIQAGRDVTVSDPWRR